MLHKKSENESEPSHTRFEVIGPEELARRWDVPLTWIYEYTRNRCEDPIPSKKLGKYTRFEWGSPQLEQWWLRRGKNSNRKEGDEPNRKERV